MQVVLLATIWNKELAQLLDPRCTLRIVEAFDAPDRAAALEQAEVLVTSRFTPELGPECKRLRLLVCPSAGTEFIDRAALPPGVVVVNGTGHEIAMAEYVIGCCVSLRQHVLEADAALRRGKWRYGFQAGNGMLEELLGSNLGLIGFGSIGREVAARAAAFGMSCAAVTLHPERKRAGTAGLSFLGGLGVPADVDRLVAWADQLVLCCELSPLTRGFMDARRFRLMKPTAVLVNVARGAVAVERDLFEALRSKRIAGAALDVWYHYPHATGEMREPSEFPFRELDNVIMTPHSSGWTLGGKRRRLVAMAKAINDFAAANS